MNDWQEVARCRGVTPNQHAFCGSFPLLIDSPANIHALRLPRRSRCSTNIAPVCMFCSTSKSQRSRHCQRPRTTRQRTRSPSAVTPTRCQRKGTDEAAQTPLPVEVAVGASLRSSFRQARRQETLFVYRKALRIFSRVMRAVQPLLCVLHIPNHMICCATPSPDVVSNSLLCK